MQTKQEAEEHILALAELQSGIPAIASLPGFPGIWCGMMPCGSLVPVVELPLRSRVIWGQRLKIESLAIKGARAALGAQGGLALVRRGDMAPRLVTTFASKKEKGRPPPQPEGRGRFQAIFRRFRPECYPPQADSIAGRKRRNITQNRARARPRTLCDQALAINGKGNTPPIARYGSACPRSGPRSMNCAFPMCSVITQISLRPPRNCEFHVDAHTRALFHFNSDINGQSHGCEGRPPARLGPPDGPGK